ncbi:hypothetical protein ABMC88_17445 [Sulfitobacter sp. HNIBRBA2951]|uniref:hypothetical protein n=1 Tax=Sulfitobacter aquimarinus TaxID=3158557 RepID=UPI0032DF91C2
MRQAFDPQGPAWLLAKLAAGKPVETIPLPKGSDGNAIRIGTSGKLQRLARAHATRVNDAAHYIVPARIPVTMRNLHPVVAAWVEDHRSEQKKWRSEARVSRHRTWGTLYVPADLTERDKYRFRVTSALLKSFEARTGRVLGGAVSGKLELEISGETFEMRVVEKMRQFRGKLADRPRDWTAFPHQHNAGLAPSGFLRFTITTYFVEGMKKEWIETDKVKADALLSSVLAGLDRVGPALVQWRQDREERQRQYEAEQQAREEAQRLARIEEQRWDMLRSRAADWHEAQRLRAFLSAVLEKRSVLPEEIDGLPARDWLAWAQRRVSEFDPLA